MSEPYDKVKLNKRISDHFYNSENQHYQPSTIALRYIDSIISFTKSNNIKTYFIALPVHKEYLKKVPTSIIKSLAVVKNKIEKK